MTAQPNSQQIRTPPSSRPIADLSPNEKRALLVQLLRTKASGSKSFYPLSDNQQGIWFLCQFAPESSIYNVSFAARIRSEVDIPAFRRAFQALVDRHPSLRTTIAVHSGKPVQQIHEHQGHNKRRTNIWWPGGALKVADEPCRWPARTSPPP